MPGLTIEDEKIIDLKLENIKQNIMKDVKSMNSSTNNMIREIHQEVLGYGKRKGMIENIVDHECRLDDHEKRIINVEQDKTGKIETRKAIFAMVGSSGFVGFLVWLSQFIGGS